MATDHEGERRVGREAEVEMIRTTERARLRALVETDLAVADPLHADDFQLIAPAGVVFSKEEYLGGIASREIDYLVWEFDSVPARPGGAHPLPVAAPHAFPGATGSTAALLAHRRL